VRAWVAIAAAYAFVLQFALAGIVATQMATQAADPFVICSADGAADGSHNNTSHAAHQACAICVFAFSASLPSTGAMLASHSGASSALVHTVAPIAANPSGRHSPRSSQGPPQNV
jgi:heme A synthase